MRILDLQHCAVGDARYVTKDCLPHVEWFSILGISQCQLSSRRTEKSVHDTSLFRCMSKVVNEVLDEQELQAYQLYENVVPHTELATIREEWDTILRLKTQDHNNADSGSMCTRPRLYWTNSVNLSEMPLLRHRCPKAVLEDGYLPQIAPMHPVVTAGDRTQYKLWCVQRGTHLMNVTVWSLVWQLATAVLTIQIKFAISAMVTHYLLSHCGALLARGLSTQGGCP